MGNKTEIKEKAHGYEQPQKAQLPSKEALMSSLWAHLHTAEDVLTQSVCVSSPPAYPVLPLELETTLVDSYENPAYYRHPGPLTDWLSAKAQATFPWTMSAGEDLQSVTTHHRKLWEKTTDMYWIERARFGPPSFLLQF